MIKIGIVVPSLKSGGLERVASIISNYGVNKYNIILITLDSSIPFYPLENEVYLIQAPKNITSQNKIKRFFFNGFWLRDTVKNLKINVICSFGEKYNPYVLLFLKGLNIPVYVANRTSPLSSTRGIYGIINPIAYRFAAGVILQTKQSIEILKKTYRLNRIAVIGNPIDLVYPLAKKKNIILNVGSFGGNKNQDRLIRYFGDLNNHGWKLCFAGDGPLKEKCIVLGKELGVFENIDFLGIIKDIKPQYSIASIFAFTSSLEGFPNALAEAMAAGCACIAYDCFCGPSDIIDDGVNGFLIPIGNEELYKSKLQLLIDDLELRERFSLAAKKKMKQFEASSIAEIFFNFITKDIENSN
jgi:GalNAc-alpha-(1->4)-GalNAc-alpha-(1->3)-diNAcBac-PP-undecaprenol alpha-1,4-N-acetyl-D-galactosaminyltransferase